MASQECRAKVLGLYMDGTNPAWQKFIANVVCPECGREGEVKVRNGGVRVGNEEANRVTLEQFHRTNGQDGRCAGGMAVAGGMGEGLPPGWQLDGK